MKFVRAVFDGLFKVVVVFNMVLLVSIVLITAANVFGRYALNSPIFWAEELCTRFMMTLGMLAAACGIYMHSHMVIEIFLVWTPKKFQAQVEKIADLILAVVGLIMLLGGVARMEVSLRFYSELPATGLPTVVQDFAIPMAGLLIVYASIMNFLDLNKGQNPLEIAFDEEKAAP